MLSRGNGTHGGTRLRRIIADSVPGLSSGSGQVPTAVSHQARAASLMTRRRLGITPMS
jgi:hypothetical protein